MEDYRLTQSGQEVQDILNGAAMQSDLTAETERATEAEQTLQGNIDAEATRAQGAEGTLQDNIDAEEARAQGAEGTLQDNIDAEEARAKAAEKQNADDIDAIEEKIPSGASSSNKLATEEYVNDSVATATATFRGTYNVVTDLSLLPSATHSQISASLKTEIATADSNDYAFVLIPTSVETPEEIEKIERYKYNGSVWGFEYVLNNSGFTAAQWAAINSGITSNAVGKLDALPNNAELTILLNGKQDTLTFDNVPTQGSSNPVKSGGVYSAIKSEETRAMAAESQNANGINALNALVPAGATSENKLATIGDVDAVSSAIEAILLLIPSAASALNQLADKAFVNSSIATATATFRGTYNLVTDLSLNVNATHSQIAGALGINISTADNNDYAFVQIPTSLETPTEIRVTERYKFDGTSWAFEYDLNNSGFTSAQWAAINSGITIALVGKLNGLPTNAELTTLLNGKQNTLTFDDVPTLGSSNPVKSSGIYNVIKAITDLIPAEATAQNQLADKADVAAKIVDAIPSWKGQYDALTDLQAVTGAKAGDMGCVKTTDSDGHAVLTFYQYSAQGAWVVYYTLRHYAQNKPATTGTTGDYPYNGMGRIELQKNIVNGVNTLTQAMFTQQNTIYVIQYDFALGEDITVPENCVLEFDGGSLSGAHTLTGTNTKIVSGIYPIFPISNSELQSFNTWKESNYTNTFAFSFNLGGTWEVDRAYPEWFSAAGDGVADDTAPIQKVLNSFNNIYLPNKNYAITQVFVNSDTKVEFAENCHVKASRALVDTAQTDPRVLGESMICVQGVSNITIIGNHSVIDMDRASYPEQEVYESRHCFRIHGSHNVYVENISGNNSFGDGLCLAYPSGGNNKNITLRGCIADNNRRQGLSLVDGENVFIEDCVFSNTHGTAPAAGIDIEPNYIDGYIINNISITNCISENNAGAGLLLAMSLKSTADVNDEVNITVNNYISKGDTVGISLQNYDLLNCHGDITFNNIKVEGLYFLAVGAWGGNNALMTHFNNCSFVKTVANSATQPRPNNLIIFEHRSAREAYIGDIEIDGLDIRTAINEAPLCIITFYQESSNILKNVDFKNINVQKGARVVNDYGFIRNAAGFASMEDVNFDITPAQLTGGLSKYCYPFANSYEFGNGNHYLSDSNFFLYHKVRFIYNGASTTRIFVIDQYDVIFDEEGKRLSSLYMADPETYVVGGRKATVGEWIEFIAKEDGWHIFRMTPLMSKYIVKTLA